MNLLKKGLIRGVIPLLIVIIFSLLWNLFQGSSVVSNQLLFFGLISFFLGLASVIYEIEQWRFIKQIIVHYLVMLVTVFPTILMSGYYPLSSFKDIANVYFLFNKMGLLLFLSTFLIFKLRHRAYMKAQDQ
ncbi:DUF3021 family protein [Rossellomorea aquimaris]|uniref:DUF3021 family protein n=1 Tax=Rossellomorea aquimaris TaxID=189382 RepID=UPI001CFD8E4F|nr:DUF3021 family protein [Rossellomorea aquimaris]